MTAADKDGPEIFRSEGGILTADEMILMSKERLVAWSEAALKDIHRTPIAVLFMASSAFQEMLLGYVRLEGGEEAVRNLQQAAATFAHMHDEHVKQAVQAATDEAFRVVEMKPGEA